MTIKINVPPLGESVTEAIVGKWHKKEGEAVAIDELIVELETDKINLEVNAEKDGVLEKIVAQEGASVGVGDLLGQIKEGKVAAVSESSSSTDSTDTKGSTDDTDAKGSTKIESNKSAGASSGDSDKDKLSPAVRKIVEEKSIDTTSIEGSGKNGRLIKGDVLNASTASSEPVSSSVNAVPAVSSHVGVSPAVAGVSPNSGEFDRSEERIRMSMLRQKIAQRLKESQNTAAMLTTFNEVDMSKIMNLRSKYKDEFAKKHGVKLGFMSFFVKAVVEALKAFPDVNAEIEGTDIIYKNYYDIGVAVGTEKGLVVPVLRNASTFSFAGIEQEILRLAGKARDGKLAMSDLTGGTFSITNGGVYGSLLSTPIINPPQSGILGMHNIVKKPVVVDDKIEIRPMMYLALSYDHRVVDGKGAVGFLVKVKELVENPEIFCLI